MTTFTIITSGGHKTEQTGVLADVVASLKGKRTSCGVYLRGTLLLIVDGNEVHYVS
jgi:hypothetical protein